MANYSAIEVDVDAKFPAYDQKADSRAKILKAEMEKISHPNDLPTDQRVALSTLMAECQPVPADDYIDNLLTTYPTLRHYYDERVANYLKQYPGSPVPPLLPGTRTSWATIAHTFNDMTLLPPPRLNPRAKWS
jgi:hypothetical protein